MMVFLLSWFFADALPLCRHCKGGSGGVGGLKSKF